MSRILEYLGFVQGWNARTYSQVQAGRVVLIMHGSIESWESRSVGVQNRLTIAPAMSEFHEHVKRSGLVVIVYACDCDVLLMVIIVL